MSTILDALRKAQEDTGAKQQPPVGEHPATEAVVPAPRRRRRVGWPVIVLGILAIAFAGGLALGDRIAALFGGSGDTPAPAADARLAARDDAAAPAAAPDVKQQAAAPAASPVVRRGRRPAQGAGDAPPPRFAPPPAAMGDGKAAAAPAAAPDAAPTPYGRLHVFGAGEQAQPGKQQNDDRLARLQELREKMLKARQEAGARGAPQEASPPAQIFVPPPHDAAPVQGGAAKAPAPPPEANPNATTGQNAAPAEGAPAPVALARADAAPAAEPGPPAVGVSVSNAQAEAADAEVHDPDIPPPSEPAHAPAQEPPVAVAAIPPSEPVPSEPAAAAPAPAAPAAAGTSPVLRRAPGGAPQVAINILQWSAEPGRRFAFVSVDGGNMTQVREGDRIGGLTIKHIHQQMIEFGFNDSTFLLRAN